MPNYAVTLRDKLYNCDDTLYLTRHKTSKSGMTCYFACYVIQDSKPIDVTHLVAETLQTTANYPTIYAIKSVDKENQEHSHQFIQKIEKCLGIKIRWQVL